MNNKFLNYLLSNDPKKTISKLGIIIRKGIDPIFNMVLERINPYKLIIERAEYEASDEPVIIDASHSFKDDILNTYLTIKTNAYLLFGVIDQFYHTFDGIKIFLKGTILVKRWDKESRKASKLKMLRVLDLSGKVVKFPEATHNFSDNLLIEEIPICTYELAEKSKRKTVPVVTHEVIKSKKDKKCYSISGKPYNITDLNSISVFEIVNLIKSKLIIINCEILINKGINAEFYHLVGELNEILKIDTSDKNNVNLAQLETVIARIIPLSEKLIKLCGTTDPSLNRIKKLAEKIYNSRRIVGATEIISNMRKKLVKISDLLIYNDSLSTELRKKADELINYIDKEMAIDPEDLTRLKHIITYVEVEAKFIKDKTRKYVEKAPNKNKKTNKQWELFEKNPRKYKGITVEERLRMQESKNQSKSTEEDEEDEIFKEMMKRIYYENNLVVYARAIHATDIHRDKLASFKYELMEKYSNFSHIPREELEREKSLKEQWQEYLKYLVKETEYFDVEKEQSYVYREPTKYTEEDVFSNIPKTDDPDVNDLNGKSMVMKRKRKAA